MDERRAIEDATRREDAVEAFLQIVEAAARLGVSTVLEFIVLRDQPESLARLQSVADCLVVIATADDALARADRRDREDPLLGRPAVLAALGHESVESAIGAPGREDLVARMRTDFELPCLAVRTDDGYDPPLDEIVDWLIERTKERQHRAPERVSPWWRRRLPHTRP